MLLLTIGSVLATIGEADWTSTGLALTLLGGLIGPLKALVMYKLITRSAPLLTPWDILYLMTPIAALQSLVIAWLVGEVGLLRTVRMEDLHAGFFAHCLLLNLLTAFVLNVCYSQVTIITGPMGMSICGNVRQILTIGFGMLCFGVAVNWLNGVGLVLAMAGLVWFSRAQLRRQGVAITT
ncbi:triose-phosphate transporter domain-containing protein [Neohortaea acidophila]|uniref:Triose-phosphate transporter domain-containing protein n=1 Tax=Neohortaea acidophila TaxID=245834 RepID=A0A6A6PLM9_9PEZI|nr:triose-phosphate transporter domain-containing protein [Neohortaea acidophila]KAF2480167.1 triose-phosphate transporter domain-containing protein [Neohortaea acidophila]